jgi:Vitamin K-dependent gamma-carboxylase
MSTLVRRLDAWLFPPAPPERLAVLRLLVGTFATLYLAIRHQAFLSLADARAGRFQPVGILSPLHGPWPDAPLVALVLGAVVLGCAYTAGAWFRVTGPVFAVALLLLTTYRSSWGQILWIEDLMVIDVLVVGLARSADACSVDSRRRPPPTPASRADNVAYGWPVRLAALVTVASYLLAAVAKLRVGGLEWMIGDSLRNHVAYSNVRLDLFSGASSPIGRWLVAYGWVFPPFAVATVILELAAPLALIGGWVRTVWVIAMWLVHVGIAALMYVVFPFPLFLVAFAPFYRLEELPRRLMLRRRAPPRRLPGRRAAPGDLRAPG